MSPEEYSREDIEALNEVRPYCFESDREEQWFKVGLQYGLDAADAEWIRVEDDLPCKHADLLESENLTKDVLVVLAWKNDPTKKHIGVCYMCNMISLYTVDFYWKSNPYYVVTHWKRLPELPDE